MKTSETINEFAQALSRAQGQFDTVKKDAINPHFKNEYASLQSVVDMIRKPLSQNNLSYVQAVGIIDGKRVLTTRIMHSSGQWIEDHFELLLDKPTMQGLGSAITYAKRYSLKAMLGVADEEAEDDGNEASNHHHHMSEKARAVVDKAFAPKPKVMAGHEDHKAYLENPERTSPSKIVKAASEAADVKARVHTIIAKWPGEWKLVADWVCPVGHDTKGRALKDIPPKTLEKMQKFYQHKETKTDEEKMTLNQIEAFLSQLRQSVIK